MDVQIAFKPKASTPIPYENYTLFMPPGMSAPLYKDGNGFCYTKNADNTVGEYVGYWDGRNRCFDKTVPEPGSFNCSVADCDEVDEESIIYKSKVTGLLYCEHHAVASVRNKEEPSWDWTIVSHDFDDIVKANPACKVCEANLTNTEMGTWLTSASNSAICFDCLAKETEAGVTDIHMSQESAPDDLEEEQTYEDFLFHESTFMLKAGTAEVYLLDCKTFVGMLIDDDTMEWKWRTFTYKNAKGYYKNARNNVVQVKDGKAVFKGNFNEMSKNVIACLSPTDLNLAELIAEVAAKGDEE